MATKLFVKFIDWVGVGEAQIGISAGGFSIDDLGNPIEGNPVIVDIPIVSGDTASSIQAKGTSLFHSAVGNSSIVVVWLDNKGLL